MFRISDFIARFKMERTFSHLALFINLSFRARESYSCTQNTLCATGHYINVILGIHVFFLRARRYKISLFNSRVEILYNKKEKVRFSYSRYLCHHM